MGVSDKPKEGHMTTQTIPCIFSGDGAGAQARIEHAGRKNPPATFIVRGVSSVALPACEWCARAWMKEADPNITVTAR